MTFEVFFKVCTKGRPSFPSKVYRDLPALKGLEDRRHILHGATQIRDVLLDSFNRTLKKEGIKFFKEYISELYYDLRLDNFIIEKEISLDLSDKIQSIITAAFSKEENLVAGFAVHNRGIEKARECIHSIRNKLDYFCAQDVFGFEEIKKKTIELIDESLSHHSEGKISLYKTWILLVLSDSIHLSEDEVEIIRILKDFEFSCTLDIVHDKTTKEQNIWGLRKANKLQRAIQNEDEEEIRNILLKN